MGRKVGSLGYQYQVRLSISTSRHHWPGEARGLPASCEKFWKDLVLSSCNSSLCEMVTVAWKQSKNCGHAPEAPGTSVTTSPPALVLAGFAAPSCPACPPLLHLPFQCLLFAVFSPMPLSCSSRLPFPASSTLGPLHQYSLGAVPSEFKVLASSQNNLETKR